MSNISFDIHWREAMMDLLDQLELETPEDPSSAPKDISEWVVVYLRYLGVYKRLEMVYDQMVHPQKHLDLKKALEATMGRLLEVKSWIVKLDDGYDLSNMDNSLVDLKLLPADLEVVIPRYYVEDRAQELADREKFLDALLEKYNVEKPQAEVRITALPPLPEEDALKCIQANERGRQGRVRARNSKAMKSQFELEQRREQLGLSVMTPEEAALRVQAVCRGFLARRKTHMLAMEELEFIGMRSPKIPTSDPTGAMQKTFARRKLVQAENEQEFRDSLKPIEQKVEKSEGQDMRETIQDKINAWFVENRHAETGEYPDLPDEEEGGSTTILNPPPVLEPEEEAAKGGKGGKDDKAKKAKGDAGAADAGTAEQTCPNFFGPLIEQSVQEYVAVWQDKDESSNFFQKFDVELVKESVRPLVFERMRLEVDSEMRVLLDNLKEMVEAERAAKTGKKPKGKKKKGKGKKGKKGKGGKEKKKKKDPTADRSIESLYAELASNGIIQAIPKRKLEDYAGAFNFLGSAQQKAGIVPDPSMAQVRNFVSEYCGLALGSQIVHEKAPFVKSCLMYGCPGTGKTLLAHALTNETGAIFFNLTPSNTDGKYQGKAVAMLIHMVFKVARIMAPSVVYIGDAEKVFITDKKKIKEWKEAGAQEPPNRIKKELLKEMKTVMAGERVIVLGSSSQPQMAVKKDMKALIQFFQKTIYVPLPDYGSVRLLWKTLIERYGGNLVQDFDMTTLAHLSPSYAPGDMVLVVRQMLTARRLETMKRRPIRVDEVIKHLARAEPVTKEVEDGVREWTYQLPWRQAKPGIPPPPEKGKKKK
ncbi:dynein regulatory complex subunit 11 [Pycnococcus provasolii]